MSAYIFACGQARIPHVSRPARIMVNTFTRYTGFDNTRPIRALQDQATITKYGRVLHTLLVFLLTSAPYQGSVGHIKGEVDHETYRQLYNLEPTQREHLGDIGASWAPSSSILVVRAQAGGSKQSPSLPWYSYRPPPQHPCLASNMPCQLPYQLSYHLPLALLSHMTTGY